MDLTDIDFNGHASLRIDAGDISLVAATSVGPRILGLVTGDGMNVFAELPDVTVECPGTGPCHLYGGHRLWAGPEDPRVTYRPEDAAVDVEQDEHGVRLIGPTDKVAGIARTMLISVEEPGRIRITHRVVNTSDDQQTLAPWAITMLPSGGRAWLPLLDGPHDEGGFQANRNLVLWPYTQLDDPRLTLSAALIEIRSDRPEFIIDGPVKMGTAIRRGWIAHWRQGVLFVKYVQHDEKARYPDLLASSQVYWNGQWGELETLGPLTTLGLGEVAVHVEEWEVHHVDEAEAERMATSGDLDRPAE